MIERHFQIPFVAQMALAEKQIQQNYRPLIAVHKWFARRPGTLFRALLLAEFGDAPVNQTYFKRHDFPDKHIFDPFMGGGTTVVEANRLGCAVTAVDINPMAWWIVRQEIQDLDLSAYREAAAKLRDHLRKEIGHLFETQCPITGRTAEAKYFLWVKIAKCGACGNNHDLFPNYLVAQDVRHTANVFVCGHCGTLFESSDRKKPGPCPACLKHLPCGYTAGRNRSRCLHCDAEIRYPNAAAPEHRLFALEYHLPDADRVTPRKGRLFKAPDAMALKSLDIFSVHGFPVGLIQCESNILGIESPRGYPVGSGGWLNITEKFTKAKSYCLRPFEIRHEGTRKIEVPIIGEWIGTYRNGSQPPEHRQVDLICGDSTTLTGKRKYDGIFTDPPYFGNVQYAELMDFCYVWLRKLAKGDHPEFVSPTTRNAGELTGNINMGRDLAHFTEGISKTLSRAVVRLKPGSPLAFTYHHNKLDAYVPLAVAILDSGLVCSASLPCPAEMGASIHINGTGSSVIDTVFVSRSTGRIPRRWIVDTPEGIANLIRDEIESLACGGLNATQGDIRCIAHGHLTRLAIWNLRQGWDATAPVLTRMNAVREWFSAFGGLESVLNAMQTLFSLAPPRQDWMMAGMVRETEETYDEVSF